MSIAVSGRRVATSRFWSHSIGSIAGCLILSLVVVLPGRERLRASRARTGDEPEVQGRCCQAPKYLDRVLAGQTMWPLPELNNSGWSKTPPIGFSYWNGFGDDPGPSDVLTRQIADALVYTGLRDAGYVYFLAFDGGWWSAAVDPPRDSAGRPGIDKERWPNGIQAVSDYIHQRGLKVGGYTDIGALGYCIPPEIGVGGHEQQDADQFARWGWDYIKVDDHGPGNFYSLAKAIVNNSPHRPMVLSFSTPATFPYEFAPRIANMWRVGDDISPGLAERQTGKARVGAGDWRDILREFDEGGKFWWAQAPGRWNDLDMLVVGLFGVSEEEAKSHFSMWAVRGAPLLIGADIRSPHERTSGPIPRATDEDLAILKNREVIAVDQDSLGASGRVVSRNQNGMAEVDAKPLGSFASGEYAVLLLNRGGNPEDITVTWRELGLVAASANVRDLWKHADLGQIRTQFTAHRVPPHGVELLRVKGVVDWSLGREYEAESSYNQLEGSAHVRCLRSPEGLATGAAVVEGIGGAPDSALQFNELWEGESGVYRLAIRYTTPQPRQARITVDGQSPFLVQFPATGAARFATVHVQIHLQTGRNTLTIDNPTALAPDIDKIVISAGTSGKSYGNF